MRRVIHAVLLIVLIATAAHAQLRGVVRDSAARAPLPGAIVSALDSAGRGVGRSITDASGLFTVALPPSARRLRIVRIGYRPTEVGVPATRGTPIELLMAHLPPMLDVVRVVGRELCPGTQERGAAFELWEQARAGLLGTIVARELMPAEARTVTYNTSTAPNDRRVRAQTKRIVTGRTTRPFVASAMPSFFARVGYMVEANGTRVFNAPDADVLIDESFAATHCFRLRLADQAHAGQIGLAFSPVRGRDTLVDVDGVIWLDAATPRLRSLDFAYTSLEPAATAAGSGGHIEFQEMPNGASFISWWNMRLAVLQPPPPNSNSRRARSAGPPRRIDMTELRLQEILDAGGAVLQASWPDGTKWSEPPSLISGVVAMKGTGAPVANALVVLEGTPDTARTDSTGRFRMETLPGRYVVDGADTTLANFVAPRTQSTPVDLRRGAEATVRLEVAPLQRVIEDICRGIPTPPGSGLIAGAVTFAGAPRRDVELKARFQQISFADVQTSTERVALDERGRFLVCGVPRDRGVRLTVEASQAVIGDTTVIVPATGVAKQVIWQIRP